MKTNSSFVPLTPKTFGWMMGLGLFGIISPFVFYFQEFGDVVQVMLTLAILLTSVSALTVVMSMPCYYDVYLPYLIHRNSQSVFRESELAPSPLELLPGSLVHVMFDGELHDGMFKAVSNNGSYIVRLLDERIVSVQEVYLKVE